MGTRGGFGSMRPECNSVAGIPFVPFGSAPALLRPSAPKRLPTCATALFLSSVARIKLSSRAATRSCSSLTLARMPDSFLLAPSSRLLASARAARLGATTCSVWAQWRVAKALQLRPECSARPGASARTILGEVAAPVSWH